jgi:predicted transcriptional regulator
MIMDIVAGLQEISLGQVGAAEARSIIGAALREPSPEFVQGAYTALRAWVWKALNERRRDEELREWFDILKRTASFLRERYAAHADRIQVLHELIYESISVSEILPAREVVKRLYVKETLRALSRASSKQMSRERIRNRLNLKEANLSRVLNLMTASGLIDRTTHGRQAFFRLTSLGTEAIERLNNISPTSEVRAPVSQGHFASDIRVRPKDVWERGMSGHTRVMRKEAKEGNWDWSRSKTTHWEGYTRILRSAPRSNAPTQHTTHYHKLGLAEQMDQKPGLAEQGIQSSIFGRNFPEDQPIFWPSREIVSGT